MSELSYNRRVSRSRELALHRDGMRIQRRFITTRTGCGYLKLRWAITVIRLWTAAVRVGVPVSDVHYPAPPQARRLQPRGMGITNGTPRKA